MKNLRIGMRLGMGFGLMLLIMIVVGLTGYWGVDKSTTATIHMIKGDASISEYAARARANVIGLRRYEKDLFLNIGNKAKTDDYFKKWQEQQEHTSKRLEDLGKIVVLEKEKEKLASMITELDAYDKGFAKVRSQIDAGQLKTAAEANVAIEEFKDSIHTLEKAAQELADDSNARMDSQEKVMDELARKIAKTLVICIIIGIILCFIISIVITRSITNP